MDCGTYSSAWVGSPRGLPGRRDKMGVDGRAGKLWWWFAEHLERVPQDGKSAGYARLSASRAPECRGRWKMTPGDDGRGE